MRASINAQLIVDQVTFSYGPRVILDRVSFTAAPGDRIGVIGPNGSGKSTLLRLLAGKLVPDSGQVSLTPPDATTGLVGQVLDDRPGETVETYVARRSGITAVTDAFEAAAAGLAEPGPGTADRYDQALNAYLAADPDGFPTRRDRALAELGLASVDPTTPTAALSGGQRTKLNLATVALSVAGIVLLDEPTNDLDNAGLDTLTSMVTGRQGALVIVSHDRAFLADTITSVLELDAHSHTATVYQGGYQAWQTERRRAKERHQQRYDNYARAEADLEARAEQQRRWAEKGMKKIKRSGESDRNVYQARIERTENGAAKAGQLDRARQRLEVVEKPFQPWVLQLRFGTTERSAQRVASLDRAVVKLGSFTLGPVTTEIGWQDRVLISGPNGGGKTTLLKALLGQIPLSSGHQHLASNARVGWMGQQRNPFPRARDTLSGFMAATGLAQREARTQLAKLGLGPDLIDRPTSELSPGEQTRTVLGVFAATGTNLLVLDEPTNHLDLEAIEELELALDLFRGTVLVVTHDRRLIESFLDRGDPDPSGTLSRPGRADPGRVQNATRCLVVEQGTVREH